VHPEITWKYFGKTLPVKVVWAPRMEKRKLFANRSIYVCGSVGILYVFKGIHGLGTRNGKTEAVAGL
jgi:hypothetical protein